MGEDEKIEFIQRTFHRLLAHEKQRLAIGMAVRNHMHEQLSHGIQIDHYRSDWIRDSIVRVIDLLDAIRKDFNRAHPEDKCSSADILDIADSVTATLRGDSRTDD